MPLVYKDFTQNVRMDSGFEWEDKNPIVNKNEIAFNYDTLQYKLGDGIHTYKQLPFCTKYFSDYTNIFPLLEGVPKESFELVTNTGGFIERGNFVNLGFTLKVKVDLTKMNPTDDINITLSGAPYLYHEMLFNDIRVYGVRPLHEAYAQPMKDSNTIKIMVKFSSEEEYGEQVDQILPLEAKEIIDDYLIIQGSLAYINTKSSYSNFGISPINPYKENKFNNLFLYEENENIKAFQFNAKAYKNKEDETEPLNTPIRIYIEEDIISEPEVGYISGNIACVGINAHDLRLQYIGKQNSKYIFILVSVIGENPYVVNYSDIVSSSLVLSGTYTY